MEFLFKLKKNKNNIKFIVVNAKILSDKNNFYFDHSDTDAIYKIKCSLCEKYKIYFSDIKLIDIDILFK